MKLGFLGTGAITEAIVTGLVDGTPSDLHVVVSPRNAVVAGRLADRFQDHVTIAASNQEVLDGADTVVIAVRPQIVHELLRSLRFRPEHLVVSLVAAIAIEEIAAAVAPATRIVRAIPLPSAAERASPTPIMPPDPAVKHLFERVGVVIETTDAHAFNAMSSASGVMAGHLAAADSIAKWLAENGLTTEQAQAYVRQMLLGLAKAVERASGSGFDALAKEHMTEGGLNEQFLAHLTDRGMQGMIRTGLDALMARIATAPRS